MIAPGIGRVGEERAYLQLKAAAQRAKREAPSEDSFANQEFSEWPLATADIEGFSVTDRT